MTNKLQILRGNKSNLPTGRQDGELLYAKDTNELYVANNGVNKRVNDDVVSTAQAAAIATATAVHPFLLIGA